MRSSDLRPHWLRALLGHDGRQWEVDSGIASLGNDEPEWAPVTLVASFYEVVGGVQQQRLALSPGHASHYDFPRYETLIRRAVTLAGGSIDMAVDFGCGDGRGTHALLRAGASRIISIDIHRPSLYRLQASLERAERDRVGLIHAPITVAPFREINADLALCIEVLTTSADPATYLQKLREWLEPKRGLLLIIEPAVEGSLAYALIDRDWSAVEKVLLERRRFDRIRDVSLEVSLHTRDSLRALLEATGFAVVLEDRISAGAAMTLFTMKREGKHDFQSGDFRLLKLADALTDFSPRMHAAIARVAS